MLKIKREIKIGNQHKNGQKSSKMREFIMINETTVASMNVKWAVKHTHCYHNANLIKVRSSERTRLKNKYSRRKKKTSWFYDQNAKTAYLMTIDGQKLERKSVFEIERQKKMSATLWSHTSKYSVYWFSPPHHDE